MRELKWLRLVEEVEGVEGVEVEDSESENPKKYNSTLKLLRWKEK